MRAAFFDYDPSVSAYRYIVLTDDAPTLYTESGGPTDEGYSYTYTRWRLNPEAGEVVCETTTDARDCDGRISHYSVVTCPVGELAEHQPTDFETGEPLPFKVPAWREESRRQRDYSAESAGY